jgi:Carbohydrate esterase, sialic acid-specific acetylesterase
MIGRARDRKFLPWRRACARAARVSRFGVALIALVATSEAFGASTDVEAKMAQFEASADAEAIALARDPMAPGGLLEQLMPAQRYAKITDPYAFGDFGNPAGREQVRCAYVAARRPAVILIAGQSNAANTAELDRDGRPFRVDRPIFNFNFVNERCYRAENPLLGAEGPYQSFGLPLAAQLIDARIFRRVLLVPIAVAGTLIEEWAPPSGHHWVRFRRSVASLDRLGLQPHFILWHHGEGNAGFLTSGANVQQPARTIGPDASPTTRDALRLSYIRSFLRIVDGLRTLGVSAPILPAVATLCSSNGVSPDIRAAQLSLPDAGWNIHAGPDTDELGLAYRNSQDNCHFSHEGNLAHARKWFEVLQAHLAVHPLQSRFVPGVQTRANHK